MKKCKLFYLFSWCDADIMSFQRSFCGPKRNVIFQRPQEPRVVINNVRITRVSDGTRSNPAALGIGSVRCFSHTIRIRTDSIQDRVVGRSSGRYGIPAGYPCLDRYPERVRDIIIDIPCHNVVFHNDDAGIKIDTVRIWSSRSVGEAMWSSGPNKYGNVGQVIANNFNTWNSPRVVPMLDGCYTIMAAWGTCPGGGCTYDFVDYPVCVAGSPDADVTITQGNPVPSESTYLEVHLDSN